ncbi:MAG TPA: cytochrome b [Steroidobacteraceae bacterium]
MPRSSPLSAIIDSQSAPELYTRTAVALHWLIALLITCGFSLGAYMVDLHISPLKVKLFNYHKWIGMTVLALALIRLAWRVKHRPPPEVPMPRWQLHGSRIIHYLLYVLLIVTPLLGWLYTSAAGYPVVYLELLPIPDLVHKNTALAKVLVQIHATLAWTLFWVVMLHIAAAIKHQFIDHDVTLRRMLTWRRPGSHGP